MMALWNWFNGNKTTIGLVLGFLLQQSWFVGIVGPSGVTLLDWICGTFLTVGLAHKIAKATTTPEPNQ